MIAYIKGILVESSPVEVIIEAGGIGYLISVPISHYAKLPQLGESLCLFVSFIVREDSHRYFGFLTKQEKTLFEELIATSGIGPKTALALLGHLEPHDLQIALSQSDIARICKVPGIGKKTAERLIVEMRDRMQKHPISTPIGSSSLMQDALFALTHLGYAPSLAQKTLHSLLQKEGEFELSELITAAIKQL